jgi:hypothetical protein
LFNGNICTDSPYYWADIFETDDYGQIGIWFSDEGLYGRDVFLVPESATLLLVLSGMAGVAGFRKKICL